MPTKSMEDLFVDCLRDLLNAEKQIIEAAMIDGASDSELKEALESHLEESREHQSRLQNTLSDMGRRGNDETCKGMEGLLQEGEEILEEDFEDDVMDAAIIGAAQKVEHYEICGYGTARAFAEELGEEEAMKVLAQNLDEEKAANAKLSAIAEGAVNQRASGRASRGGEPTKSGRQSTSAKSRASKQRA